MMVVIGGLLPNLVLWQVKAKKLKSAKFGGAIHVSDNKQIDGKLVLGSLLFGLGWGYSGICPGPALTNAVNAGFPLFSWRDGCRWTIGGCILRLKEFAAWICIHLRLYIIDTIWCMVYGAMLLVHLLASCATALLLIERYSLTMVCAPRN